MGKLVKVEVKLGSDGCYFYKKGNSYVGLGESFYDYDTAALSCDFVCDDTDSNGKPLAGCDTVTTYEIEL